MLYGLLVSPPPSSSQHSATAVSSAAMSAPWAVLLLGGVALHLGLPDLATPTVPLLARACAQFALGAGFALAGIGGLTAVFALRHRQQEHGQLAAQLPGGEQRISAVLARRGPGAALLASAPHRGAPVSLALLRRAEQLDLPS